MLRAATVPRRFHRWQRTAEQKGRFRRLLRRRRGHDNWNVRIPILLGLGKWPWITWWMPPVRGFTSWTARLGAIYTRNNRPLAPQPFFRPVEIDNQSGILCHVRPQTLAFALFPFFSLEHRSPAYSQFTCFLLPTPCFRLTRPSCA
jgi:hypothetical protein